jgi:anti-sigma-K factor RskA
MHMADPDDRFDDDDLAELRQLFARAHPEDVEWQTPPAGVWDRIAAAVDDEPGATGDVRPPVVPMITRRRRWLIGAALATAAAVLVVVTVAVVAGGRDDTRVLSTAALEPLGPSGSGRAELVSHDGALQLDVETQGLDAGDGYLELWLIDPTVSRLVSLGPLRADGTYEVPPGVDPAQFPIVDVSVEPVDGDPTHSGDSVLRGELTL